MSEPWRAECEAGPALARSLIEDQFPVLRPVRARPLAPGWDNTVYCVNDVYVFRFPRRAVAVACMEAEIAVLPALPPLPLSVSVPEFVGRAEGRFPWPFAGYAMIGGIDASVSRLRDDQRALAAAPLGRFLAALHAIDAPRAAALGAKPDPLGRFEIETRTARLRERIAQIEEIGLPAVARSAADALAVILDRVTTPARTELTLVHGDFYCRNLLVDAAGRPCGVIDWGDVHVGHPAVDLSIAYGFLPASARSAFTSAYGVIDDTTAALARFRAFHYAVILTLYGHDTGNEALMGEGVAAFGRVAAGM